MSETNRHELDHSNMAKAEPSAAAAQHGVALVRHEDPSTQEKSTCGWRYRLISENDKNVDAWMHVVDIDGAKEHYHKRATELYYVLEGEGTIRLDGVEHPIRKGSAVYIPPGVVHGGTGSLRVLVVGIPDLKDDLYFPDSPEVERDHS